MPIESLAWILGTLCLILVIIVAVLWRANYSLSSQFADLYEKNAEARGRAGTAEQYGKMADLAMEFAKRSDIGQQATNAAYIKLNAHLGDLASATGRLLSVGPPDAVDEFIAKNKLHDDRTIALLWTHYYVTPFEWAADAPEADHDFGTQTLRPLGVPTHSASKVEWLAAAEARGLSVEGMTKPQIIEVVREYETRVL